MTRINLLDVVIPVRSRAAAPLLVGIGVAVATAWVVAVDPAGAGPYPGCPFLAATRHPCPLCGGLRAVHELGRGDLAGAVSANLMVLVLLGLAAAEWLRWLRGRLAGRAVRAAPGWGYLVLMVAFVGFGLIRNLPFGTSLAP